MYLSKLELNGFKSFATRTVLHFDPGITAIVGPNGCGKSNIVDAVRWVIGEQRARILRSEKMENVIFNGTANRRPLGMAEVQLTVENTRGVLPTEYSEVTLGRRLYRSGESEYLLNDTTCRLRDIVDLFMDTGMGAGAYSVIELKMVEEILSDNAQDRRHLFEEAAGITKYKQRRAQALRKLDTTQADLTRLRDLTEEIEHRVNSLKRQAARAKRFQKYEKKLHRLELTLAQVDYDRLTAQQRLLEAETQHLHDTLEGHTARVAKDEAALETLRKTLVDREHTLSEQQQRLSTHLTTVRDLEADLRLEQERIQGARREHERVTQEQERSKQKRTDLQHELELLISEQELSAPLLKEAEHVLQEAEADRDVAQRSAETQHKALNEQRRRMQEIIEDRAEQLRRLDRLVNRIELLDQEQERLQEQHDKLDDQIREHEVRTTQAKRQLRNADTEMKTAQVELRAVKQQYDAHQNNIEDALRTLHQLEREHEAIRAEVQLLDSLVSSLDEFPDAVQFLAAHPSWTPATPHTVADVLACDPEHRPALDAALGVLASCLIVETKDEAQRAIARLRDEKKGRATFLALDHLPDAPAHKRNGYGTNDPEAIRPLCDLVRVSDPIYAPVAEVLLRDWYLAASAEQAHELAITSEHSERYVAPSGEWTDARGFQYAGSKQVPLSPAAARLGRGEQLEKAREHMRRLERDLDQQVSVVETQRALLEDLPLETRRSTLEQAEHARAIAKQKHERLLYEYEALTERRTEHTERLDVLDAERVNLQAEMEPLQAAVAEAEEQIQTLRIQYETAEGDFLTAEAEHRAAQEHYREAHVAAVEARNRHDVVERDLARTRRDLDLLADRAEQRQEHLASLQQTINAAEQVKAQLQQRLDEIRSNRSTLEDAVSQAKTALLQTKVDIDKVEVRLRKLRQAREETIREENVRAVRKAEIQTRKDDLLASIEESFGRSLADEPVNVEHDFDTEAARDEVQALRRKVKQLGNVNPLALDEYETERERFEFMNAQKEDLEQAEATLLETIDEINTTAAARFMETYEAIRESFHSLFTKLFGQDASADLSLADADDPLESAIDITAKPRGKRPIGIAQLSSGEKTLTAIALLFAIYLVKPSPFCILDEVDAPLDDANIDRFMRLIRRFADDTQFILVTHNKRTMKLADRLYGITMQEQGVSQLVGVKFEEALAMAG